MHTLGAAIHTRIRKKERRKRKSSQREKVDRLRKKWKISSAQKGPPKAGDQASLLSQKDAYKR